MVDKEKQPVKYRIKSYHYEKDGKQQTQLLFTIEEIGTIGEIRKFANEIMIQDDWQESFSDKDIEKINYAAKMNKL